LSSRSFYWCKDYSSICYPVRLYLVSLVTISYDCEYLLYQEPQMVSARESYSYVSTYGLLQCSFLCSCQGSGGRSENTS